ncbi:hypothetical protein IFU30_03325 [Plantibacter sp. CFBP 8798]|uniref:hypothetical protein n=1 Tax=Plantibacter sp. CFBP 8798 TaxID=2775268 RepID=UPI0017847B68|nr:hypothetical protein [Plantibacter sp. CFBP 8798]MBD8465291.1 hypothetical protein [Plantibacter sp. CFBP 8798]
MTPARRRTVTIVVASVMLVAAASQLGVLLTLGWSGDRGDIFQLVLIVAQLAAATVILVAGLRARPRTTEAGSAEADDPDAHGR